MSLPLLVCLLLPEPEGIVVCMDTMNFVSHVVECPTTVAVYSGAVYAGGGRYSTVFENTGFPSSRWYILEDGFSDGAEECTTLTP